MSHQDNWWRYLRGTFIKMADAVPFDPKQGKFDQKYCLDCYDMWYTNEYEPDDHVPWVSLLISQCGQRYWRRKFRPDEGTWNWWWRCLIRSFFPWWRYLTKWWRYPTNKRWRYQTKLMKVPAKINERPW